VFKLSRLPNPKGHPKLLISAKRQTKIGAIHVINEETEEAETFQIKEVEVI